MSLQFRGLGVKEGQQEATGAFLSVQSLKAFEDSLRLEHDFKLRFPNIDFGAVSDINFAAQNNIDA